MLTGKNPTNWHVLIISAGESIKIMSQIRWPPNSGFHNLTVRRPPLYYLKAIGQA
ncbi:hypothetical protein O209_10580 [Lactiplantibacillus plantarum WHE 92]|nr:hypothetical protein O209_10580 [Lactiplantibacillus plantarum WHE 92]